MLKLPHLSKTDVSAILSVVLFMMTILISAVGPAEAQGSILINDESISPTVCHSASGYLA